MGLSIVQSTLSSSPNIIELYQGQSKDIELRLTKPDTNVDGNEIDSPLPLSGCRIFFTVKVSDDSPKPLIFKDSSDVAQIALIAPLDDGVAILHIDWMDTYDMQPGKYRFDVWVEDQGGKRFPVVEPSDFIIKKPITRIPV